MNKCIRKQNQEIQSLNQKNRNQIQRDITKKVMVDHQISWLCAWMIKTKHFYYIAHAENVTKCTFQQATFDAVCLLKSKELRSRGESLRLSQGFLKGLIASTIICLFFCYDKYSRHLIYTADQYTFRLHCSEIITLLISAQVFIPDVKCKLVSTRL